MLRLNPPHKFASRGAPLAVSVYCAYPKLNCQIRIQAHAPLKILRHQVASLLAIKPAYTQLWLGDELLRVDRDTSLLSELKVHSGCKIEAKQVGQRRQRRRRRTEAAQANGLPSCGRPLPAPLFPLPLPRNTSAPRA